MKAPFKSPYQLRVTQEYGNTSNNTWYLANGITAPFHNGIDICFGTPIQTYGTPCICPFDKAKVVKLTFDTPLSAKGNGITIESYPVDGVVYQVVFWHTGEINVIIGQELKLGDVVCYIGNSGLVNPQPDINNPYNGSHCHLMLFKYVWTIKQNGSLYELQDENNGVNGARNPRELFDFTQWTVSNDTGLEHDIFPILPYVKQQGNNIMNWLRNIGFFK
jgi:hypothetical protein